MKYTIFVVMLFPLCFVSYAQNANIDKLKKELAGHPALDAYRVDRLNQIVRISANILPNDERMKMVTEAMNISRAVNYLPGEGYALLNTANAGRNKYTKEERDHFIHEADSIGKKSGDLELQAYVALQIGDEKRFTIESEQVLSYYLKAEEIATRTPNKELLAACQGYLAEYYEVSRTDHATALEYALKAIDNSEQANSLQQIAYNYKTLAAIYRELGEDDNTSANYQKALDATRKYGSIRQEANLHTSIGLWYHSKSKYREAIDQYKESIRIGQKASLKADDIAIYEGNLATTYLAIDSMDLAIGLASHALAAFENVDRIEDMAWCLELLGEGYFKKKMADSSIYYSSKSLQLAEKTGTLEFISSNSYTLSNAYALKKRFDSAYKYHVQYLSYKDSIMNVDVKKKTNFLQYKYDLAKKQAQITSLSQEKRIQKNFLISAAIVLFLIIIMAIALLRNNRLKYRANKLLKKQKLEIEEQRDRTNKAMDELQQTQKQLVQSEKMASLGELTAGIAHEIQNPLNFVNNFSEVNEELISELVNEVDKGNKEDAKSIAADLKQNLQKVAHHGRRADAIVKAMLQHSRSSTGQKEPTDINALCDEYLRLAYHGLRAKDKAFNAKTETDFDSSIGKINVVSQEIGRVILNLISNAFYAVDEKKKLIANSSQLTASSYEPTVSISTKNLSGKIEIRVTDNGNGIPPKILDKIFQPFFTTKPAGQGTGLGLSLSYDVVKTHGGELKVETKEGEGSTFIINL